MPKEVPLTSRMLLHEARNYLGGIENIQRALVGTRRNPEGFSIRIAEFDEAITSINALMSTRKIDPTVHSAVIRLRDQLGETILPTLTSIVESSRSEAHIGTDSGHVYPFVRETFLEIDRLIRSGEWQFPTQITDNFDLLASALLIEGYGIFAERYYGKEGLGRTFVLACEEVLHSEHKGSTLHVDVLPWMIEEQNDFSPAIADSLATLQQIREKTVNLPSPDEWAEQFYANLKPHFEPEWWKMIDDIDRKVGSLKGDIPLEGGFLFLLFMKPDIAKQFHISAVQSQIAYINAVKAQNPRLVNESAFFVEQDEGRIKPTAVVERPAAYDLPIPDIKTCERDDSQTIAMLHTHPPRGDILSPSVIVEDVKTGFTGGDLYAFVKERQMRRDAIKEGRRPPFTYRSLLIILQEDFETETVKMLFIREGEGTTALRDEEYIETLRVNNDIIRDGENEYVVSQVLNNLGFRTSYLEKPSKDFYNYPFLNPVEFYKIETELI